MEFDTNWIKSVDDAKLPVMLKWSVVRKLYLYLTDGDTSQVTLTNTAAELYDSLRRKASAKKRSLKRKRPEMLTLSAAELCKEMKGGGKAKETFCSSHLLALSDFDRLADVVASEWALCRKRFIDGPTTRKNFLERILTLRQKEIRRARMT